MRSLALTRTRGAAAVLGRIKGRFALRVGGPALRAAADRRGRDAGRP